ncbi:MAG: transglutaminase-like domain-containing protein [Terriglobia bacterium]
MRIKFMLPASLAAMLSVALFALAGPQSTSPSRTFEFTYKVQLTNLSPEDRTVRVWIPLASSDVHQRVVVRNVYGPVPTRITREAEFGDRMVYAEMHHPNSATAEFKIVYKVTRLGYSKGDYASLRRYDGDPAKIPAAVARFLRPDRLVPTDGLIRQIAMADTRGKQGEIEKAYALYNYVFHHMRYDKAGTGWGHGDALWACDSHHGNCTDFHSLFMALARSSGIPARFVIGFQIPAGSQGGPIPGYHCWVEFYAPGAGWVPADISEAWLDQSKHDFFFGSLDADRVRFSTGRDLTLSPKQGGPPVNYFVYPYAEVNGKPYSSIKNQFSFHDLQPVRMAAAAH